MANRSAIHIAFYRDNKLWCDAYNFKKPDKLDGEKLKEEICNMIDNLFSGYQARFKDDNLLNCSNICIRIVEGKDILDGK